MIDAGYTGEMGGRCGGGGDGGNAEARGSCVPLSNAPSATNVICGSSTLVKPVPVNASVLIVARWSLRVTDESDAHDMNADVPMYCVVLGSVTEVRPLL